LDIAPTYIEKYDKIINNVELIKINGKVTDVIGLVIVSIGPNVAIGEICQVVDRSGREVCKSEVVAFKEGKVLSIALGEVENISPSCTICATGKV
jgi:flagellum-specific ATP synthase